MLSWWIPIAALRHGEEPIDTVMTRFDSSAISRKQEDLQPNFPHSPSSSHFLLTGTLNLLDQQSDLSHFSKTNSKISSNEP
jgi:hypothetical protein